MTRAAFGLAVAIALMPMLPAARADAASDQEQPILSRDLRTLAIPGKVAGVLWTVRPDRCTLQVVFPNAGGIAQAAKTAPHPGNYQPSIQVWLLRADGTVISPMEKVEPSDHSKNPRQPFGMEVLYAYSRSAATEAVAIAIRVDESFLIERLGMPGQPQS